MVNFDPKDEDRVAEGGLSYSEIDAVTAADVGGSELTAAESRKGFATMLGEILERDERWYREGYHGEEFRLRSVGISGLPLKKRAGHAAREYLVQKRASGTERVPDVD